MVNYDTAAEDSSLVVGSTTAEKPLGQLMGDVVSEMGTLVRQEIALAKVETKEELTKAGKVAGMFGGAAVAGHMALLFLSLALAWLLGQAINRAAAFAIVGILYALAAGLLALTARTQAQSINPVPEQTVETLKEDVQWAKAQKS
jgi:uncharacterized membrane protein YqjE